MITRSIMNSYNGNYSLHPTVLYRETSTFVLASKALIFRGGYVVTTDEQLHLNNFLKYTFYQLKIKGY